MDDLNGRHDRLVATHRGTLCRGAERLLGKSVWSFATTAVLHGANGA
ncbi:hypothetical protein [Synechococcus sp. CCY 9618]|nr:hypothetical protein [Synechococcus sp. CCY 9618]